VQDRVMQQIFMPVLAVDVLHYVWYSICWPCSISWESIILISAGI